MTARVYGWVHAGDKKYYLICSKLGGGWRVMATCTTQQDVLELYALVGKQKDNT